MKNGICDQLQAGALPSALGSQQKIYCEKMTFHNFGIIAPGTAVILKNCRLDCDFYGDAEGTCIRKVKSFLADGCTFYINPPKTGNAGIALQFTGMTDANVVEFRNSTFNKGRGLFPGKVTGLSKQFGNYSQKPDIGVLKLTNCTFNGSFDYCYQSYLGDTLVINGMKVDGAKAGLYLRERKPMYPVKITITGQIVSNAPEWIKKIND